MIGTTRSPSRIRRWTLSTALLFGLLHCGAPGASASVALEKRITSICTKVSTLLKAQGYDAISIGQFTGPPNFPTSSGPGLVQLFSDGFSKHSITCKTRAPVGISGSYGMTEVEQFDSVSGKNVKHLAVRIEGKLVDQFGSVITDFNTEGVVGGKFETTVPGSDTFVEVIGVPAHLPPEGTPTEIDHVIRDQIIDPKVHLNAGKTILRTSARSPYGIEVLVDGHPAPIHFEEDLPYVDIRRGQTYAIKVYNDSPYDAAVKLLIDGLSVFTFSEVRNHDGSPKYTVYIVKPHLASTLKGWHKTNQHVDSFLVTEYAHSAAATLGHKSNLGTITVNFSAAWVKGTSPPPDEIISRSAGGNATGFGPPIQERVKEVKRDIGRVRDSLTIRYTR